MKSKALLAAAVLLSGVVNANAVVYTTSGISPDGAVSAKADVTYNAATHILTVVLTNLTASQHSSGQSVTGFYFDVASIASTGAFTQAGNQVTLDFARRHSFHREWARSLGGRPRRPE